MPMFDSLDQLYAAAAKDSSIIQTILSPNPVAGMSKHNITLSQNLQSLVAQIGQAIQQNAQTPVTPEMLTTLAGLLAHPDQLRLVQLLDKADLLTNPKLAQFGPSTNSAY